MLCGGALPLFNYPRADEPHVNLSSKLAYDFMWNDMIQSKLRRFTGPRRTVPAARIAPETPGLLPRSVCRQLSSALVV